MQPHYSLSELNRMIKQVLQSGLDASYWIVAEIAELRVAAKGHCYLELVDKSEQSEELLAKMRANIWSYSYRSISGHFEAISGQPLRAGLKVLANVQVQFHEVYGISLVIKDIDPNYTLGERMRQKMLTIEALKAEGVFELNKKLPLPMVPQRIAIISAATAAGFGDFMDQLAKNVYGYSFHTRLFNAVMQGNQAATSIILALEQIKQLQSYFDLVIIIRGGGSQVDLDCFDERELCAQIATFPLPVITGIGHERDQSIADLVAHTGLKTPTAVAEFLIKGMENYESTVLLWLDRLQDIFESRLIEEERKLQGLNKDLFWKTRQLLAKQDYVLERSLQAVDRAIKYQFKTSEQQLAHLETKINILNPVFLFKKGYSFVRINGTPIQQTQKPFNGDEIQVINHQYDIKGKIESVNERS
jgi:exodeoxyribonuclease VII large subunit